MEETAISSRAISGDLTDKVTFGQRQERGKSYVAFGRKCIPGRGSSTCKGPESGVCLAGLKRHRVATIGWNGMSKAGSDRRQDEWKRKPGLNHREIWLKLGSEMRCNWTLLSRTVT